MEIGTNVKAVDTFVCDRSNNVVVTDRARRAGVKENFALPPLYCPFPSAVNPHVEAAERHALAWAERLGMIGPGAYQHFRASKFSSLAVRAYPTAPREELLLACDWITWLLLTDDQTDESELGRDPEGLAALHRRFLAVLQGAQPTDHDIPHTHALADIRQRLGRKASAEQMRVFILAVRDCFDAIVREAANRVAGVVPDVATYVEQRQFVGAVYTTFPLVELCEGIDLPPSVRDHRSVRELARMANNVVCWCNDLYSFEKELEHGDQANLVGTLRAEHGLTLQAAVTRAAEMHDAEVRAFLTAESALPSFGAAADVMLERYVAGLRSWMRGNFEFSQMTARYRSLAKAAQN